MTTPDLFQSFFLAGFECSTHRRKDRRRLDLLAATAHDRLVRQDYRQVLEHGIRTCRDGLRWHLIEKTPGHYDWSSFLPMLRAARSLGVQVIWDLCHYGWPDDIDIWEPAFVDRYARFAGAVARLVRDETDTVPFYCPINEISFWSWAAGEMGIFFPCARHRGDELKRQLVRAAIAGIEAVWSVDPRARIVHADPLIHVVAGRPQDEAGAAAYCEVQFQSYDMLAGRAAPELGGRPDYLDVIGVNFYSDNQWFLNGPTIQLGHPLYRPLHRLLGTVHERYGRPVFIAETGAEVSARAAWLFYVTSEVRQAIQSGVPIQGICLYPIIDFPGWENDRMCDVGLLGPADAHDRRRVHQPLADELHRQQELFAAMEAGSVEPLRAVGQMA